MAFFYPVIQKIHDTHIILVFVNTYPMNSHFFAKENYFLKESQYITELHHGRRRPLGFYHNWNSISAGNKISKIADPPFLHQDPPCDGLVPDFKITHTPHTPI
jgi:hypothetical protein